LLYLIRLADQCHVNLPAALDRKIRLNNIKYPEDQARGNAAKYTEYNTAAGNADKRGEVVNVAQLEAGAAAASLPTKVTQAPRALAEMDRPDSAQPTSVHWRGIAERFSYACLGATVAVVAMALLNSAGRRSTQ
jgi:hypothetical protein